MSFQKLSAFVNCVCEHCGRKWDASPKGMFQLTENNKSGIFCAVCVRDVEKEKLEKEIK